MQACALHACSSLLCYICLAAGMRVPARMQLVHMLQEAGVELPTLEELERRVGC